MHKLRSVASVTASTALKNIVQYEFSHILMSCCLRSRMHQNQVRKRTSARLLQKADNSHHGKLSTTNLRAIKGKNQDPVEQHITNMTKRKRKTNAESFQGEEPHLHVQVTVNSSKRPRSRSSVTSTSDEPQISSKKTTLHNKKPQSNSGNHQSTNSTKPSKLDSSPVQSEQTLSDQDLLVKYRKRLEDLKKSSVFSTTPIFETLCTRYEKLRNDSKATAMSKYMRNKFEYFGISSPQRRSSHADLWKDVTKLSSNDLRTLAHQTWFSSERELHYFTVELLEREIFSIYGDEGLSTSDLALKTLNFVKTFIEHPSSWWDTVDPLSSNVVGPLVQKYPTELLPEMDKWNTSSCFWLCRTSILYQLSYKKDTDAERLFRYCLQVAEEEEFFLRKAIGWALRQYYRINPVTVRNFVQKHKNKLSPLSVKEALKHDK